jgi:uncharacterized protein DUF4424
MRAVLVLAALALLPAAVRADDSPASLAAGGIVLVKRTDIRMASEDLFVGLDKISVRLEFVNDGAKDVDALLAFPLPDIDLGDDRANGLDFGQMTKDPENFVGFTTRVNGKPVAAKAEQRAWHKGKDVTATVKALGYPINTLVDQRYPSGDAASAKLRAAGLLTPGGHFDWAVRTRFYWMQHFPRGRTVVVEHEYRPVTGSYGAAPNDLDDRRMRNSMRRYSCLDARTEKAWRASLQTQAGFVDDVSYVLKTARNWKGPIGRFRLVVDKGKPENLMTLCWSGRLVATSPTRFEFAARDFVPRQDVDLMVLE